MNCQNCQGQPIRARTISPIRITLIQQPGLRSRALELPYLPSVSDALAMRLVYDNQNADKRGYGHMLRLTSGLESTLILLLSNLTVMRAWI